MGLAATKQEAFWEACGFGNKDHVRKFIAEGIDVNWISYTHNSCAIHVASQGKKEIVQMLIEAGCNVHALDDRGNLALHHAAMKGHSEIVQILIDAGSDVNSQDKNGWTPLICASYFCQPSAVETLLKNNCSVSMQNKDMRTALHEVCRSPCDDEDSLGIIARHLIAAGSDLNSKSSDLGDVDFTPLMFCAYHGHRVVAQELIAAGCDINAQGSNGWTALHWAVDRDRTELVQILLEANINILTPGKRGELAVSRAQNRAMRKLLLHAADPTTDSNSLHESDSSQSPVSTLTSDSESVHEAEQADTETNLTGGLLLEHLHVEDVLNETESQCTELCESHQSETVVSSSESSHETSPCDIETVHESQPSQPAICNSELAHETLACDVESVPENQNCSPQQ